MHCLNLSGSSRHDVISVMAQLGRAIRIATKTPYDCTIIALEDGPVEPGHDVEAATRRRPPRYLGA